MTETLYKLIGRLCTQNKAVRDSLRRTWLKVLDDLIATKYPNISPQHFDAALISWQELAERMHIDEGDLRLEAMDMRKEASGGTMGCVWVKCPLYERESSRVLMRCSVCERVSEVIFQPSRMLLICPFLSSSIVIRRNTAVPSARRCECDTRNILQFRN